MGIGAELIKVYREYYPSKTSGGFTSFGYNQAQKYHAFLVRRYMRNGIYSDMVNKKEITIEKVKEIIGSIKDIKKFSKTTTNPLAKYYGDTETGLYIGDNYVIVYDKKLMMKNNLNLDNHTTEMRDLIFGKVIKGYISIRWNEKGNFNDLYTIYAENKTILKQIVDISLSMNPEGISNRFYQKELVNKETKWIKEIVNSGEYLTRSYELYKNVEYYDIVSIKKPIPNIKELSGLLQKQFKQGDPYEEFFNTLIETAEIVARDYNEEVENDYYFRKAIDKIKAYHLDDPEWIRKNFNNSGNFAYHFGYQFGEERWKNLEQDAKSHYSSVANNLYHELVD